jgi:hypothetical protein
LRLLLGLVGRNLQHGVPRREWECLLWKWTMLSWRSLWLCWRVCHHLFIYFFNDKSLFSWQIVAVGRELTVAFYMSILSTVAALRHRLLSASWLATCHHLQPKDSINHLCFNQKIQLITCVFSLVFFHLCFFTCVFSLVFFHLCFFTCVSTLRLSLSWFQCYSLLCAAFSTTAATGASESIIF